MSRHFRQKDRASREFSLAHSLQPPTTSEWQGLFLLITCIFSLLCLGTFSRGHPSENALGFLGYILAGFLYQLFGFVSFVFLGFIGWVGWRQLFQKPIRRFAWRFFLLIAVALSGGILLSALQLLFPSLYPIWMFGDPLQSDLCLGGCFLFEQTQSLLVPLLNPLGIFLIATPLLIYSFCSLCKISISPLIRAVVSGYNALKNRTREPVEGESGELWRFVSLKTGEQRETSPSAPSQNAETPQLLAIRPERNLTVRPSLSLKGGETLSPQKQFEEPITLELSATPPPPALSLPNKKAIQKNPTPLVTPKAAGSSPYSLPPDNLLNDPKPIDPTQLKNNLRRQAEVLEETLQSFGIDAKVGQVNCGPTITSFEVHPSIGVKVQKIKALEHDIALNMEARSIRIIAPIPGKAAVGIEVPNSSPQEVSFKHLLASYLKRNHKCHIPLLLGKAVNGDDVIGDLAKMPHLIIAGATGSGKSVCINTIVMSIVMNLRPDQIRLLMVDPKKVELTPYTRLPHMLAPVITEPQGACAALCWLVREMESRYELLKVCGVRNIDSFNKRKRDEAFEASLDREIPLNLPYIVCIVDELADLMMVSSHDIETPIARIAQMARAVGIHMILATQRPSREVITGIIKANFPTRIAFKVSSRVNSQIILDEVGAEGLLGNGDMLYLPPGTSQLIRAQGAFIRDEEIHSIVEHVCRQSPPRYVIPSFDDPDIGAEFLTGGAEERERDTLYDRALEVVQSTGQASTTFLQRKLKIGYARAASLIDQLEEEGVIGPVEEGVKGRRLLSLKSSGSDDFISEE